MMRKGKEEKSTLSSADYKLKHQLMEVQSFVAQLPELAPEKIPLVSRVLLLSCLFFGLSGVTYYLSAREYFSPGHTNAQNLFFSLMCHLGVVIGPAALFALKCTNYSVYPLVY